MTDGGNVISAKIRQMDAISTLLNIYGSPEQFIKEYQQMLEHRLLSNINYNRDQEYQNLELMKLRFGEKSMLNCERMLRDMKDSERINREVQQSIKQ